MSTVPWFRRRPALTLAAVAVLYAAVLGLRFAVDDPGDPVSLFHVLPIALVAVTFGRTGGLVAGVTGVALVAVWVVAEDVTLSGWAWTSRAVPMLLLGVLLGDAVDRLRASERERLRLAAVEQRHRDALELQDGVVQQLAGATWALQRGRTAEALDTLTGTLRSAQRMVTEMLKDAGMGPPPPEPAGGHRILLREVVIDAPSSAFPATRDFWSAALLAGTAPLPDLPEFTALVRPASVSVVGLQDVGTDAPRFHVDIESDDVAAEVRRLVGLGAREVSRGRTWTVLRDPAGLLFCVIRAESVDFATRSRLVRG